MNDLHDIAARARNAYYLISDSSADARNHALTLLADLLKKNKEQIFEANREDLEAAKAEKLADPLLHRLAFNEDKLLQVTGGLTALAAMQDPLNHTVCSTEITEGLKLAADVPHCFSV